MAAIVLFFFDMVFFVDLAYAIGTAGDYIANFATMEGAAHFWEKSAVNPCTKRSWSGIGIRSLL
jgi:hypothetical protein